MPNAETLSVTTPSERELVMTRVFQAPRRLVFDALTRPELLRRWYGPAGWSLVVCEIDLRVGGAWRFVSRKPDGKQVEQHGVYREIVPPERVVNTEAWADWDAGEVLATTVLTEADGRTTLTSTTLYPSRAVRDTLIASGLNRGAIEHFDRLASFVADEERP